MRRYAVVLLVLGGAFATGAGVYTTYANDRDYVRFISVGDEAAASNDPFLALESYSGAIALRPDSMLAHLKRGRTYRERGELEAAARDLRRAAELDRTATLPLELLGDTYMSLNRYDRAADRFQAYLALDDRSAGVWYKLGLALYRSGQATQATRPLERSVALDASLAEAQLLLGLCLRDAGDTAKARAPLERATRLAPGLTAPREALAAVYTTMGDNPRAIDQLEALAALDPTTPARLVALGMAYARARRHESAVLTLSRAVERFPDESQVYGALGRVWLDAAEVRHDAVSLKNAIEALTTAASHPEATSATLTDLGRAWVMAGDTTAAERALRQAIARLPVDPEAYLRLASVIVRDHLEDARDALIRYVALVGDTGSLTGVLTDIAAYSLRLGQPELALKWIARAVDESGDSPVLAELRQRSLAALGK